MTLDGEDAPPREAGAARSLLVDIPDDEATPIEGSLRIT